MEEVSESTRYWCYACSMAVETITDSEMIKCSFCHGGFVEEIDSARSDHHTHNHHPHYTDDSLSGDYFFGPGLEFESESITRRRQLSPAEILQLLRGGSSVGVGGGNLFDSGGMQPNLPIGSIGDYFVGPDGYGTPPAQKEAVEAMLTVKIEEDSVQCLVCSEDIVVGNEAKEMPCRHRFHGHCILPWLELHSSCPVCRYQFPPSDDSKLEPERESSFSLTVNTNRWTNRMTLPGNGDIEGRNTRRIPSTLPWPLNNLFLSTPVAQLN